MSKSNDSFGGVSFLSLLTVLFIGLKLTGYIMWSWWWVLAPLWGSIAFGLLIMLGFFIYLAANRRKKFGPKK
jgi:membrane protein YdbS with pleckstrin-like domain